jgi:hypothetical protein
MSEMVEVVWRVIVVVGIVAFTWSVSSSLERIAAELARLRGEGKTTSPPPAEG